VVAVLGVCSGIVWLVLEGSRKEREGDGGDAKGESEWLVFDQI
jgi:hypothetical protein